MIIDKIDKNSLIEYLQLCSSFTEINVDTLYKTTVSYINQHDKKIYDTESFKNIQFLFDKWYKSLENGQPDYTVYLDPYYFCEVWLCWVRYSRRTLKEILSKRSLFGKSIFDDIEEVSHIIDLGCGFGYTTASLKEIFKYSRVLGTNVEDSMQYKIAEKLSKEYNFEMSPTYKNQKTDLIFASEYFEHFERPIEHLIDVLINTEPKYLIIANSFGPKAIGHFNSYKHLHSTLTPKQTSKIFTETLKQFDYDKIETKCWNNRPTYFVKK